MSTPCPQCRHENSETVEFCTQCHTRLRYACPACQHLQTQGDKCEACGVDFAAYETAWLARIVEQRAQTQRPNRSALVVAAIVAALVVAGGVWWGVQSQSEAPKSAAPRTTVAPPPPAEDEKQAVADSLRVLQNLRGLTEAKVNYMDYAQKALDSRITVDHIFAASAWNAGLRGNQQDEQGPPSPPWPTIRRSGSARR